MSSSLLSDAASRNPEPATSGLSDSCTLWLLQIEGNQSVATGAAAVPPWPAVPCLGLATYSLRSLATSGSACRAVLCARSIVYSRPPLPKPQDTLRSYNPSRLSLSLHGCSADVAADGQVVQCGLGIGAGGQREDFARHYLNRIKMYDFHPFNRRPWPASCCPGSVWCRSC